MSYISLQLLIVFTLAASVWNCACQGLPRVSSRKCLRSALHSSDHTLGPLTFAELSLLGSSSLLPSPDPGHYFWWLFLFGCIFISWEEDTCGKSRCQHDFPCSYSHQSRRTRRPGLNLGCRPGPSWVVSRAHDAVYCHANMNEFCELWFILFTYLSKQLDYSQSLVHKLQLPLFHGWHFICLFLLLVLEWAVNLLYTKQLIHCQ